MPKALPTESQAALPAIRRWSGLDATSLVFIEWCLRRETPRWRPSIFRLSVLIPAVMGWWFAAVFWPSLDKFGAGSVAISQLLVVAGITIFAGGIQFASRAVCWEISPEMRDLVRLTGLDAGTLLWAATLSRWWTIGWSILLMMPLAAFAVTLGGVNRGQLITGAGGLALLTALTCSMGMLTNVLTANSKNPEKAATNTTALVLILYNLSFVVLSLMIYTADTLLSTGLSPSVDQLSRRIANSAPAVSISHAFFRPTFFSPTDPGYWGHFLTAIVCAWLATIAIKSRFRNDSSGSAGDIDSVRDEGFRAFQPAKTLAANHRSRTAPQPNDPSVNAEAALLANAKRPSSGRRRRCSERPFFWKDVYILSDERKRVNTWTAFYCLATVGVLFLSGAMVDYYSDAARFTAVAIGSIVVAVLAIALRFDALLTTEFREKTWGTLMLLPVDPCDMLWAKLQAAVWEQRFVAMPVGMALLILIVRGTLPMVGVVGIVAVISPLIGGVLCQISCINQLLGKAWWVGPIQAFGFIVGIVFTFIIWINSGMWIGFLLTSCFLIGILWVLQASCVNPLARDWVES